MSYTALTLSLLEGGKANIRSTWALIKSNFEDHQARINALEQVANLIPSGTIVWYGSATIPSGYLGCDGSLVSRATYATLFSTIGTFYGAGDGVSTFKLPDYRGRSPAGDGTGTSLTARTIGDSVGEETHPLVTGEIASHTHGVTDPGHLHNWANMAAGGSPGQTLATGSSDQRTAASATGVTLNNAGSGTAHNNMQPFVAVGYLIKY